MPSLAEVDLTDLTERWIYERLQSGLTAPYNGRIHKGKMPGGRELPAVKFTYQSDAVVRGVGLDAYYFTQYHYAVRGVTHGTSTGPLGPIAAGIYSCLADVVAETAYGLVVLSSTFFSHFRLEHDEGNEQFVELGGIYQIQVQLKE